MEFVELYGIMISSWLVFPNWYFRQSSIEDGRNLALYCCDLRIEACATVQQSNRAKEIKKWEQNRGEAEQGGGEGGGGEAGIALGEIRAVTMAAAQVLPYNSFIVKTFSFLVELTDTK